MDFTYDEEQVALREAVRGLLGRAYGDFENRRRAVADDPGYDAATWGRMAEMGLLALPFAEDDGGVGAGPVEVGVVAEEIGRVLAPEPYLAAVVLAGGLVAALGTDEQRAELVGGLASGELVPALAHAEPGSRWSAEATAVTAQQAGDAWTLDGVKEPVPFGASADVLLVTAALPGGGTGVFVVDPSTDGVTRDGYRTPDGGRAARVRLAGATGTPLGEAGVDRTAAVAAAHDATRVAAAQQAVGAMQVALETTAGYLKSREQFGVPLKTFQALTFRAADMYVALELARSLALWATMVHADPDATPEEKADAARRAWAQTSAAGRHVGQEAIQLHGGIAMTAEYSTGSYTAHLTALDHLLGDARHHLGLLALDVAGHGEVDPLR
ncbi:acyl-CoA dehydrogenase family protein [Nocardioides sp. ChNu-99]|uniref:acyl-CoA dehydrogenase family protein n=1 Tax=Nocardioides sp. ChNu-99 TaxID=2839897 RepID=UPI0024066984|nr:acyl-CoA dehydrogenase family protein [Nocardioides sp. ChNu-99]MDF9716331.1 acyl-CoA/acyl-ACP dehydrogenase [Nocardioides sp. ChNu-99]